MKDYEEVYRAGYAAITLSGRELHSLSQDAFDHILVPLAGRIPLGRISVNAFSGSDLILAGPGSDQDEVRAYSSTVLRRAQRLGIRYIGIGSPASRMRPEGVSVERMNEDMLATLTTISSLAKETDTVILLEALCESSCNYLNRTADAAALVERLDSPRAGLVYDIYHSFMAGEAPDVIDRYGSLILVAHLSGHTGGRRDFLHACDIADYQAYFTHLTGIGYDGEMSVEASVGTVRDEGANTLRILRRMSV